MSHTPGPYRFEDEWTSDRGHYEAPQIFGGTEDEPKLVATLAVRHEMEANGHLLAASWEMLQALNNFPMLLAPATTAWGRQVQDWQDKCLAAIAKATGGQQ